MKLWIATLLLSSCLAVKDTPFFQEVPERFTFSDVSIADWKQLPFPSTTRLLQVAPFLGNGGKFYLMAQNSLWYFTDASEFERIQTGAIDFSSGVRVAGFPGDSPQFVVASPNMLYRCQLQDRKAVCKNLGCDVGPVNDLAVTSTGSIYVGSKKGLFFVDYTFLSVSQVSGVSGEITAVAFDNLNQVVAAGAADRLWRFVDGMWYYFRTPGIIDDSVSSLGFDGSGNLWIGNDVCVNKMSADLTLDRVDGLAGLPYPNITSISVGGDGGVWFGTLQGASRYHPDQGWQYYYGPRWFPSADFNNNVISIAASQGDSREVMIATTVGISVIRSEEWTLKKKADHYQSLVYPRHDRYGLVSEVGLNKFGDLSSYYQRSSDNDGLWTSIYLASQCFRYAVTKDPEAKKNAWHSFEAMEFLNNVTGIKGLMARSVLPSDVKPSDGTWHNSTVYPGWQWKGDTSSDEVTGHLFVYPLVYDLVAETPQEKARAKNLIQQITTYIVKNGFYLIDVTGKPTTWGKWAPEWVNDTPNWYDQMGLNALQMLAYLVSAYRVVGDPQYMKAFNLLVDEYGYGTNIINQKITQPSDDNFSDDELAFLPYFTYIWANQPVIQKEFTLSISRAFKISKPEKSSLWNVIYGASGAQEFNLQDAIWCLQTWPLSQIDWPVHNSNRTDVFFNPNLSRWNELQGLTVLPYDEISMYRWNGDPFDLDGGSGFQEVDPSAWLLPYWMARYYQFIEQE